MLQLLSRYLQLNIEAKFRLCRYSSVFAAELTAIMEAVLWILKCEFYYNCKFAIFSQTMNETENLRIIQVKVQSNLSSLVRFLHGPYPSWSLTSMVHLPHGPFPPWSVSSMVRFLYGLIAGLLQSYMEDHLKNKDRLDEEWQALCAYEPEVSAVTVASLPQNERKNRYSDILPCEYCHVLPCKYCHILPCRYCHVLTCKCLRR